MMNDESIARKIREIALLLENWRVEFFRKCDPNSYYAEEKESLDDTLYKLQWEINEVADEIDPF